MKKNKLPVKDFSLVFKKLEETKKEQLEQDYISEADYSIIDESILKLKEIQQNVESYSHTLFTRS